MANRKISSLSALTAPAVDDVLPIVDTSETETKKVTVENLRGRKEYIALLTQSGINPPVAVVLRNTLGSVPVWSYEGVGSYVGTLAGAFTVRTAVLVAGQNAGVVVGGTRTGDNTVSVTSRVAGVPANDAMVNVTIRIEVYPV